MIQTGGEQSNQVISAYRVYSVFQRQASMYVMICSVEKTQINTSVFFKCIFSKLLKRTLQEDSLTIDVTRFLRRGKASYRVGMSDDQRKSGCYAPVVRHL